MKVTLIAPIQSIHGKLSDKYYARVVNGKQIIQRCPVRNNPPTQKQIEARKRFIEKYRKTKSVTPSTSDTLLYSTCPVSIDTTSLPLATSSNLDATKH